MDIISREEWGAKPAKRRSKTKNYDNGWFWHWLGKGYPSTWSDEKILKSVQAFHMGPERKWTDIAYSYAVGRNAKAYELRGKGISGGHTKNYNSTSMAIVFLIGEGEKPTPAMFRTAYAIMATVPECKGLRPHRAVGNTACPGDDIANEIASKVYIDETEEAPMPKLSKANAEIMVESAYDDILNRPSDPGGKAHWTQALLDGYSYEEIRWSFMFVRLAAIQAVLDSVNAALSSNNPAKAVAGVTVAQVLEQFYDDLIAARKL